MAKRRKIHKDNSFDLTLQGSEGDELKKKSSADYQTIQGGEFEESPSTGRGSGSLSSSSVDVQEQTFRFGMTVEEDDDDIYDDNDHEDYSENTLGRVIHMHVPHHKKDTSSENLRLTPDEDTTDDGKTILESFNASSPKIKRRVMKSLNEVMKLVDEDETSRLTIGFNGDLSERLSRANSIGNKMIPKVVFPSSPKLFRDAWVLSELLLTVIQFIYSFFSTNYRVNRLYNTIYIVLSSVNLLLSLIDSFYYFYELGSCMVLFRRCKKRCCKKKSRRDYESLDSPVSDDEDSDIDDEDLESITSQQSSCCKCCRISAKRKEQLNMWFELIRNILSELLIYPLVVLDLFGVISDPEISDKINFSFFMLGSFYLVMSVYVARVVITILTLLTMKNLLSSTKSGKNNVFFIIRFLFHSIGQVVVHMCCVVAVGIKIKQENDHNNGHYHASPILWLVIFGGWLIPFLGVISYFIVNYYWAQQFSVGFFIELMSLLQEGDVAGSLMHSKDEMKAEADERAQKILEKMEYKDVKKEYKELESSGRLRKVFYPTKLPLFIVLCIIYNFALGGFFASLFFTSKQGDIVPIQINDYKGITLLVIAIIIGLANIHLILVSNVTIIVFVSVLVTIVFLPGFMAVPIFIVLYLFFQKLNKLHVKK